MSPTPSIVTLSCGCFFRGREFFASSDCETHENEPVEDPRDEEWSCDRCGETAQDDSGICITCGAVDEQLTTCDRCGREFPLDHLDAKPTINSRLRRIRAREGQRMMLYRAALLGFDFDRLECRKCYGPGYSSLT